MRTRAIIVLTGVLMGNILLAQTGADKIKKFEVTAHIPLNTTPGIAVTGISAGYAAQTGIEALSYTLYAPKADRIVTFGDEIEKHVAVNAHLKIYTGAGVLIKSAGEVAQWPFAGALDNNGFFYLVGNRPVRQKPSIYLMKFDANGNKQWEQSLPDWIPGKLFVSNDHAAVVLMNGSKTSVLLYNSTGAMIMEESSFGAVSAVEMLPDNKVVICTGSAWHLYNLKGTAKEKVASGVLKGNTVGDYPVTSHPSGYFFTILSVGNPESTSSYCLQAFDSNKGSLIAQSIFEGKPSWQPFRLTQVSESGDVELKLDSEMIRLKIQE